MDSNQKSKKIYYLDLPFEILYGVFVVRNNIQICPSCDTANEKSQVFCKGCGRELKEETPFTISNEIAEDQKGSQEIQRETELIEDVKEFQQLAEEVKSLREQAEIYGCIFFIGIVTGSVLSYVSGGAIVGGVLIGVIVVPCMILWIRALARHKKLRNVGLERMRFLGTVRTPQINLNVSNVTLDVITTCSICNQPIISMEEVYSCQICNLMVHKVHFMMWFQEHDSCPSCKK